MSDKISTKYNDDEETKSEFVRNLREKIEESSSSTGGIRVFEHATPLTMDKQERIIFANLKIAHEKWKKENEK